MTNRVKVKFAVEEGSHDTETMYAIPSNSGSYVLDNSPFYAFGISYCDEFKAKIIGGDLFFDGVTKHSGHSTYRIRLPINKDHEYFLKYWTPLADLGCSYEGSSGNRMRLYAVDMPTSVDVFKAYEIIDNLEKMGIWEFEEGHYYTAEDL